MDISYRENNEEGPYSTMENTYKYPSCDTPKSSISISESPNSTRYETFYHTQKRKKRVQFNQNVTVVNIQSHKKTMRKQNYQKYTSVFEEDFKEDHNQKCVNCIIF